MRLVKGDEGTVPESFPEKIPLLHWHLGCSRTNIALPSEHMRLHTFYPGANPRVGKTIPREVCCPISGTEGDFLFQGRSSDGKG